MGLRNGYVKYNIGNAFPIDDLGGSRANYAGGLRFNSADDALDFARDGVERANSWLATNSFNLAKKYVEGGLHLVLKCGAVWEPHIFDLVFRRVPFAVADLPSGSASGHSQLSDADAGGTGRNQYRDEHAVRLGYPYAVKTPKQLVPSLVWLESSQERSDFRRIAAQTFAIQLSGDASGVTSEGEPSAGRFVHTEGDSACIDGVVEGIAKVSRNVFDDGGDAFGQLRGQAHLVHLLAGLSIEVDNVGAWFSIKEGFEIGISFANLLACALNQDARAFEWISGHG